MRVLIVDDHPIIVSGCRALLEGEPEIEIIEAQDGAAGFAAYFNLKPDVGVIDINLPGFSGLELLRRILEREPEARLVIFSMNDDPIVAARAIEAGAKGYIAKNDDPALFADAIKTVANGGRYLHPEMARRIAFLRAGPSPDAISNLSAARTRNPPPSGRRPHDGADRRPSERLLQDDRQQLHPAQAEAGRALVHGPHAHRHGREQLSRAGAAAPAKRRGRASTTQRRKTRKTVSRVLLPIETAP